MKKRKTVKGVPQQRLPISVRSCFKYGYLVAFFVLLSGLFHPLITGGSPDGIITGTLVLFAGLAGGILMYRAAVSDSAKAVYLGAGLGLVALSLYFIFYIAGRL